MKSNSYLPKMVKLFFLFICLACAVVTLLPWWPTADFLIIPKYILLFAPRWWLLVCVLLLATFWPVLTCIQKKGCFVLFLLSLNFLDFQLPKLLSVNEGSASKTLTIISANIGGGGSINEIRALVKQHKPDILLLQEALKIKLAHILGKAYFSECISGLCIASKHAFERVSTLDRKFFGGWGKFAVFYNITTPYGDISLANIHLETPRTILMGAIYRDFNTAIAEEIESNREIEANLLNIWFKNKQNVIIAGDFNMPEDENLYQKNFTDLNNAIGVQGFGFNKTKYTSWHGIRIDHILFSDDFSSNSVKIIDDLKGDHKPVIAKLFMVE